MTRALCLATGVSVLLALLAWFVTWIIIIKLLSPVTDEITFDHLVLTFKDGKQVTVVSVPAYQLAVPTGVTLDKHSRIQINADGLVLTIGGLINPPTNILAITNEVARRTLMSSLDRDSNPSWRLPDGTLYYGLDDHGSRTTQSQGDPLKLMPEAEYGCLLAFAVPRGTSYPDGVFEAMAQPDMKFFKIGSAGTISFDQATGKFQLDDSANEYAFHAGDEIYLTINDAFVRDAAQIKLSQDDLESLRTNHDRQTIEDIKLKKQYLDAQREICNRSLKKPYGIWYLDNRGSFTATVQKQPE